MHISNLTCLFPAFSLFSKFSFSLNESNKLPKPVYCKPVYCKPVYSSCHSFFLNMEKTNLEKWYSSPKDSLK